VIVLPFCPKCGVEVPADAAFCMKCGAEMAVTTTTVERRHPRREKREKDEKQEKDEKREKDEKSGDRTGVFVGGLILIWFGISFYLVQAQYIGWNEWWPYLLAGIGVILIAQAAVRYSTVHRKGPVMVPLIGGLVLLMIGLASIMGMKDWWPFVLIAIGIVVIIGGATARARTPRA
jgi:hypothetical protein